MIAGLSWGAWALLVTAVGTGLTIQVISFVRYRRRRGGRPASPRQPGEEG